MLDLAALKATQTLHECIDRLLTAWDEAKIMYSHLPREEGDDHDLVVRWSRSLAAAIPVGWVINTQSVVHWWRDHGESLQAYRRALCLHHLLKQLDLYFADKRVICKTVDHHYLALGRRWWNAREVQPRKPPNASRSGRALSDYHQHSPPFLNMRRTRTHRLSVVENPQVQRARLTLRRKSVLRIALVSLSGRARTFFRGTAVTDSSSPQTYGFVADGVRCDACPPRAVCEEYLAELRGCVREACRLRVDVLCFPELCVCGRGRHIIREVLSENPKSSLLLVVAGSYHDERLLPTGQMTLRRHWRNRAPVWTAQHGQITEVATIEKFVAYSSPLAGIDVTHTDEVMQEAEQGARASNCFLLAEDIESDEQAVVIETPVGLWGIMICRDALVPFHNALDSLRLLADHIVVISMSRKGAASFRDFAEKQATFNLGAVYYVNAAQVLGASTDDNEEIHALWRLPSREADTSSSTKCEYVTDVSPPSSKRKGIKPRLIDGWHLIEIGHRGLI